MRRRKFPHQFDELALQTNYTIEDDLKLSAELAKSDGTPREKWAMYKRLVTWVSFADRIKREISNRGEVYYIMDELWRDVKKSKLYKK